MTKAYQVYGLICPHDHNVFYVGVTINPHGRLQNHMYDPISSAWEYCTTLREQGLKPYMVFFGVFDEKSNALDLESQLIRTIPNLHNKYGNPHKQKPPT